MGCVVASVTIITGEEFSGLYKSLLGLRHYGVIRTARGQLLRLHCRREGEKLSPCSSKLPCKGPLTCNDSRMDGATWWPTMLGTE